MTEKCVSLKGIESKLEQLVDVSSSYIKSRETQDARWTVTREHGQKLAVQDKDITELKDKCVKKEDIKSLEKNFCKLDIELHGSEEQKENGYNGICGDVKIIKMQISAFPSLLEPMNKSIEKINDRNSKRDAVYSWKANIPNVLLTLLSIISIVGSLLNLIKG
jgi:hypothetical protein